MISIPRRLDHLLRNWAHQYGRNVECRVEEFIKFLGENPHRANRPRGLSKLLCCKDREVNTDAFSIRWNLAQGNITRKEAVREICLKYPKKVNNDIWHEFVKEATKDKNYDREFLKNLFIKRFGEAS